MLFCFLTVLSLRLFFFFTELEADLSRTKKYLHDLAQMHQVQNLMNVMVNPLVRKKRSSGIRSGRKSGRSGGGGGGDNSTLVEIRRVLKSKKKKKSKKNKKDRDPVKWEGVDGQ